MSKIYIFLLLLLGLAACTAPIDINTDNSDPVIVIYGEVTDSLTYQSVRVSSSSPYFDNEKNAAISGAKVTITSSENETFELQENDTIKGLYQTINKMAAKVGVSYHLSVLYDFDQDGAKEMYEANSQMQQPATIDSIQVIPMRIMGRNNYQVRIYAQDAPNGDEYFLHRYLQNDTLLNTKISQYQLFDDEMLNGEYINGIGLFYFPDISEKSNYTEDEIKDRSLFFIKKGDTITLELSTVEKGYFNFISQCQSEMRGENPFFGGPASNIQTNITNGGVGYFSVFSIAKASAVTP